MLPEFDLQWLLLGVPLAFAFGWLASRADLRQLRRERRDAPRTYFQGLNLLLNEQQDKAIDAFIEAVQEDPDTTELHFALGNLFRRRGEFERAVRVHQHLLARADLKGADRDRAQRALAQDYMTAGLFDRAELAWQALDGTPFEGEARLALLSLYERSRDWRRASEVAARLEAAGGGSFAARIAHHQCELAVEADGQSRPDEAEVALQRALATAPQAARPHVLAGQRLARAGRHAEALAAWDTLLARQPAAFVLVCGDYAHSAAACGRAEAARRTLAAQFERQPSIDLVRALESLGAPPPLLPWMRRHPTLSLAEHWLEQPRERWTDEGVEALRHAVGRAARPLQRYRCAACGFEAVHWFWQCPGCLNWDSYPTLRLEEL